LVKNAQRINLADKKENKGQDPLFAANFLENLSEKYQQDIFFNRPDQDKFRKGIDEARTNFYWLYISFLLKYKNNKKIDYPASLRKFTGNKSPIKTKAQQEEDFEKVINQLEIKINSAIADHVNKFPSLTSLKQLNQ